MDNTKNRTPDRPGDRRLETRLLCSDLVTISWSDESAQRRKEFGVLEDLSHSGACILMGIAVPPATQVSVASREATFHGSVRHCTYGGNGYAVGIQFEGWSRWSDQKYRPEHLLDPGALES